MRAIGHASGSHDSIIRILISALICEEACFMYRSRKRVSHPRSPDSGQRTPYLSLTLPAPDS